MPPSPCGWLMCASGWTTRITTRLDAQTPGVRTTRLLRTRTSSLGIRGVACARPRSHAKTLSASCRMREGHCSRPKPPCNAVAPDAVASIAARPAVRDDRDPPLVSGRGVSLVRQIRNSVKWNVLHVGLDRRGRQTDRVFCPPDHVLPEADEADALPPKRPLVLRSDLTRTL